MGKIFGSSNIQVTPRQELENKYNSARSNLLIAIIFTVINIALLFLDADSYFLFSLFVPYGIALFGMIVCGKMPQEWYGDDWANMELLDTSVLAVTLVIVGIIILLYLLSWIFSKKSRVGWLIFALVLFCIDTVSMLFLQGISADTIIDIVFHIWIIVSLVGGISAHYKLKKMPVEEADGNIVDAIQEDSQVLRVAEEDVKSKILLETVSNGLVITYRRVKRVNELVINGNVYDEYEALLESPHNLSAVIMNYKIEAGYDGFNSYIKVNGEIVAKKMRLA